MSTSVASIASQQIGAEGLTSTPTHQYPPGPVRSSCQPLSRMDTEELLVVLRQEGMVATRKIAPRAMGKNQKSTGRRFQSREMLRVSCCAAKKRRPLLRRVLGLLRQLPCQLRLQLWQSLRQRSTVSR